MNSMAKSLFHGDDEEIYKRQKINEILNSDNRSQRSFAYNREKNELAKYCNQIFSSFKEFVQEFDENEDRKAFDGITSKELNNNPQFTFDLDALKEIVDHLSDIPSNILEFDIDVMIKLNMHEFIIENISKICDLNYETDFEILSNILHLTYIWTNGKNEQSSLIFDQNFTKYIFNFTGSFFVQNYEIVDYCLNSVSNLLTKNYFSNDAIPIIMTELLLLLDQYINESQTNDDIVNYAMFQSTSDVFKCFQPIIKNYLQEKELRQLYEINGLVLMLKKWIDFIQNVLFDSDQVEDDIICKSACSAIYCMSYLVDEINIVANDFFTKEFIEENLINYLRSTNMELKKAGLCALKCAFTTVGYQNYTAWEFVRDPFWKIVSKVIEYEHNYEFKLCFINTISDIIRDLPSVLSKSMSEDQNDDDDEFGQNQSMDEDHKKEGEEEEESRDIEDDNDRLRYQNEIISSQLNLHLMNLYDGGILDSILSLAGKSEEKIGLRIKAILAVAQNISLFSNTEIGHIVDTNVIPILIDSLEIVDEDHVETIVNAILEFFKFIDRVDIVYKRKCIDMFEKANIDDALNGILENPLYEGKFDKTIILCADRFRQLSEAATDEQKKIYKEIKERRKIYGDDDDYDVLREYEEEYDDGNA